MQSPELKERFAQQGIDPETSTPEQFGKLVADEYARWAKVIRASGIRME